MKPQFLLCTNPNKPEQGTFIYHAQHPRFLAKINESGTLEIVDNIDNVPEDKLLPKMNRASKWYLSTKYNYARH